MDEDRMEGMEMGNALAVVPPAPAAVAPDEWNQARIDFVRRAYCGGAPDAIAATFIDICRRRRLSPEERHVYLVARKRDGRQDWVIQTGIDGYRLIADRTRRYAGSDEPAFVPSGESTARGKPYPAKASVTVWKLVDGVRCPFTGVALWDEYNAGVNNWLTMPHTMLAKCAEAQALRKAFPAELAGIYATEEMDQAGPAERPTGPPAPRVDGRAVDRETGELVEVPASPALGEAQARAEAGAPPSLRGGMTGRQHGLVRALQGELGMSDAELHDLAGVASLHELDAAGGSALIDRLKALAADAAELASVEAAVAGSAPVAGAQASLEWTPLQRTWLASIDKAAEGGRLDLIEQIRAGLPKDTHGNPDRMLADYLGDAERRVRKRRAEAFAG